MTNNKFNPLINIFLMSITLLFAQTTIAADVEKGKAKSVVCNHCHTNNSDTSIPLIDGQHQEYLVQQMLAYRSGKRQDEIMQTVMQRLDNEQDIYDLAAYYSSLPQRTASSPKSEKKPTPLGHAIFNEKANCFQCHGKDGQGDPQATPVIPTIAGQNKDYIIKRLMEFQQHQRGQSSQNPMPSVVEKLDIVDIFSVAEYVSEID